MSEFVLHPDAVKDLEDIWENPQLIASMQPTACAKKSTMRSDRWFHSHTSGTTVQTSIAYAADEKPLAVIAMLHGRRNPRIVAAILRNRK